MATEHFWTLFAAIVVVAASILGGLRYLFRITAASAKEWQKATDKLTQTNRDLELLGTELKRIVMDKEKEHNRLEGQIADNTRKIERHEQWHWEHKEHGD